MLVARGLTAALLSSALLLAGCAGTSGGPVPPSSGLSSSPGSAPPATTTEPASVPLREGERLVELGLPGGSYTPAPPRGGSDDYRCFLLDPTLGEDAFVTGVAFRPGNPAIVHHAILYRIAPQQVAAAEAADAAGTGTGWTCFGFNGVAEPGSDPVARLDSAPWLAGWAPGAGEQTFGRGTGVPMPAGSRIVLQVHYNLREGSGSDDSTVALRLTPGTADLIPLHTTLLPAPVELPCAAGQSAPLCDRTRSVLDVMSRFGRGAGATVAGLQLLCSRDGSVEPRPGATQSCDRKVRTSETVYAVGGHMHLLGRSIRIELDPGTPQARVLLDRPVWNFDDQRASVLPVPVRLRAGDTLRVTCTHDAALRDKLPELEGVPPRYVVWGEGTGDEMCLGILLAGPS